MVDVGKLDDINMLTVRVVAIQDRFSHCYIWLDIVNSHQDTLIVDVYMIEIWTMAIRDDRKANDAG